MEMRSSTHVRNCEAERKEMMVRIICTLPVLLRTTTTVWTMAMAMAMAMATAAAAAAAAAAVAGKECPSPCHCYQQFAGGGGGDGGCIYSIFCVATGLRDIPQSFDFYAQILNFTGNGLAELTNDSFGSVRWQRLEIVDLSANGIKTVARDAFAELKNLLELDLSDNRIETIRAAMLRNNRFLNTIRLSGNPIKVLGERAFPLSVYLRTLHFQGCRLKRIHRYTFFSTPLLQHLNLKDNALESPPLAVLRLTQLRTLQLDGNPWKCDRRLRRVLRWLRGKNGDGNQSLSLLCVFGETQNAVFWHTMEVDGDSDSNFEKFHERYPRREHRRRRRRRWVRRRQRRQRRRDKRAISASSRKAHIARHHKTNNLGGGGGGGEIFESEPEWMSMANGYEQLPSGWNFSYTVPLNCTQHYEYSPTRFLKNHNSHARNKAKTAAASVPALVPAAAAIASAANVFVANATVVVPAAAIAPMTMAASTAVRSHPVYHNAKIARAYVEHPPPPPSSPRIADTGGGFETNGSAATALDEPRPASSSALVRDKRLYGQYEEGSDAYYGDGDNFVEKNHAVILTGEVVLIVILLIILYQLWKENRKRVRSAAATAAADAAATAEPGVNFPLNKHGGARVKSYDTQTDADVDADGYRRYSLSDEEYSNIRNGAGAAAAAADEGKYDAESGYLSYHRYNSVEGDNANKNDNGGDIDTRPNNRCDNGIGTVVDGDSDGDTRAINNFRRCSSTSRRRSRTRELQHSQHLAANGGGAVAVAVAIDSKVIGIGTRLTSDRSRTPGRSRSSFSDSDSGGDDDDDDDDDDDQDRNRYSNS